MSEIVPKIPLKKVLDSPKYLAGLMNYGGISVPVIDFSLFLGEKPCKNRMHTRIMLFTPSKDSQDAFGLMAEKITETRNIDSNLFIQNNLETTPDFFDGILNSGTESIQRVNIECLYAHLKQK